jgi:hypothetical protein
MAALLLTYRNWLCKGSDCQGGDLESEGHGDLEPLGTIVALSQYQIAYWTLMARVGALVVILYDSDAAWGKSSHTFGSFGRLKSSVGRPIIFRWGASLGCVKLPYRA